jgi:hypothetical protein
MPTTVATPVVAFDPHKVKKNAENHCDISNEAYKIAVHFAHARL